MILNGLFLFYTFCYSFFGLLGILTTQNHTSRHYSTIKFKYTEKACLKTIIKLRIVA